MKGDVYLWKINMEPEDHLFGTENHLNHDSKPSFQGFFAQVDQVDSFNSYPAILGELHSCKLI